MLMEAVVRGRLARYLSGQHEWTSAMYLGMSVPVSDVGRIPEAFHPGSLTTLRWSPNGLLLTGSGSRDGFRSDFLLGKAPELTGQSEVIEDPLIVVASVRLPVGREPVAPPGVREFAQLRNLDGGSWPAPAEPPFDVLFRPE